MTQPSYVSGSAAAATGATSAASQSITVSAPPSIVAGNMLIAVLWQAGNQAFAGVTLPSGWARDYTNANSDNGGIMIAAHKTATGSEPGSYTFTVTASGSFNQQLAVTILQYADADTTAPIRAAISTRISAASSTTLVAPSAYALTSSDVLVCAFGVNNGGATISTAPTGMTRRQFATDNTHTFQVGIDVRDQALSASGETGTRTEVMSVACLGNATSLIITGTPPVLGAVTDSFNRANTTNGLGGTSDGLAVWTTESAGVWAISSNQAKLSTNTVGGQTVNGIERWTADGAVQVTVATVAASNVGVAFRISDGRNYWHFSASSTAGASSLSKVINGIGTTVSTGYTFVSGDVLKAVFIGSSIAIYRNGTLLTTVTDTFNQTATRHGLMSGNVNNLLDAWSFALASTAGWSVGSIRIG